MSYHMIGIILFFWIILLFCSLSGVSLIKIKSLDSLETLTSNGDGFNTYVKASESCLGFLARQKRNRLRGESKARKNADGGRMNSMPLRRRHELFETQKCSW